jgi:AcrR family transcriptional regulator
MNKKDEIISAASSLFSEKGYDLSMSDIAGKVGIKTPSLYSHFESKDEIIGLVLEKEMTNLYDFFNQTIDMLENKSTELKLKQLFQSIFEYFNTPGQLELWRRVPFIDNELIKAKCTKIILEKDQSFSLRVKKIIEEGIISGEIKENADEGTILLYLVMIQGLLDTKLLQKFSDSQLDHYTLSAWEAFWNGIKA